ncbi:hypothetical protein FBZ96_11957 [Bradyrhizobium stylosanthis]|uniref:Uncharacterized protein n=1 Tax=Bradyrhizobium stylosanthis TaxID=1803665 RepID=A0A560CXK5_9BRAD|nr:hypothetical protein FBZ96_11957 [Bradyrhizobium stylosanthis]
MSYEPHNWAPSAPRRGAPSAPISGFAFVGAPAGGEPKGPAPERYAEVSPKEFGRATGYESG